MSYPEEPLSSELRLQALYQTHSASVRASCRAILRDAVAAEDATQETFLRVQRHLATAEQAEDVASWIHRIAMNYCLNELRNRSLRRDRLASFDAFAKSSAEDGLMARDQLRRLLRKLPARLRVLVELRYLDGLDQHHIAAELGVSRRTIVSRLTELRLRIERVRERDGRAFALGSVTSTRARSFPSRTA